MFGRKMITGTTDAATPGVLCAETGPRLKHGLKVAGATAMAAGALLATGGASMQEAGAAGVPKAVRGTVVMESPTNASRMTGGFIFDTPVTQFCWVDTSSWAYGTNRWFKVQGPGYDVGSGHAVMLRGYVSANRVVNQLKVPRC